MQSIVICLLCNDPRTYSLSHPIFVGTHPLAVPHPYNYQFYGKEKGKNRETLQLSAGTPLIPYQWVTMIDWTWNKLYFRSKYGAHPFASQLFACISYADVSGERREPFVIHTEFKDLLLRMHAYGLHKERAKQQLKPSKTVLHFDYRYFRTK